MSSTTPVLNVLLVDDRELANRGLPLFFRAFPDFTFTGKVSDIHSAIEHVTTLCPDVVVVDLKRPEVDGARVVRLIRTAAPDVRIVVLANSASQALMREVTEAGADAVLTKDISIDALAASLRPDLEAIPQPAEA